MQGLTEFLPISSKSHLALYDAYLRLKSNSGGFEEPLLMSVLVHIASLLAILFVFRKEVVQLLTRDRRLGFFIILATIPAIVVGLLFHNQLEKMLEQPVLVGKMMMIMGLILVAGEVLARGRKEIPAEQGMTLWQAFTVGIVQACALLPGISRSGSTISAGRVIGLSRETAVRFSFLLAIPAIACAGGYESLKVIKHGLPHDISLAVAALAFIAAFASSVCAILLLLKLVRRVGLWVFSPYLWLVGAGAIMYFGR